MLAGVVSVVVVVVERRRRADAPVLQSFAQGSSCSSSTLKPSSRPVPLLYYVANVITHAARGVLAAAAGERSGRWDAAHAPAPLAHYDGVSSYTDACNDKAPPGQPS